MDSKVRLAVHIAMAVAIIGAAGFAASGVGNIAGQKIVAITPNNVAKTEAPAETQTKTEDNSEYLAYNRNLFNQKAGQTEDDTPVVEEKVETIPEDIQEIAVDGKRPILTDLRVLLKGTQVASDPAYSIAMFMPLEGSDVRMKYLHEGDKILDEAQIIRIVRNRVYMIRVTQNDRLEYIDTRTTEEDLAEAKKVIEKLKAAETKPVVQEAKKDDKKSTEISADVIKKVGADTYEIPRDTIEQIRKNPNILKDPKFGAIPQIQPVYKGGGINGFRLLGVQSNSIYAQLGLKSGDTILDINGQQIDNPQKAMSFFDALQPGQDVGVKINRAGAEKTLTFQLK